MLRRRALYNGNCSTFYFVESDCSEWKIEFTIAEEATELSSSSAVLKYELLEPVAKYKK